MSSSPAVERSIRILDYLATHRGQSFTLSELSRRVHISKATTHAILAELTASGYLEREHETQRFRLGPAVIPLAPAAESGMPSIGHARNEARELADRLGVQAVVVWASSTELIYLAQAGLPRAGGFTARPGQRLPLVPPLGTAFLAWSEPERVKEWLKRLGPDADAEEMSRYRAALEAVRRRGYAVGFRADAYARLSAIYSNAPDEIHTPEARAELAEAMGGLRREPYLLDDLDTAAKEPLANNSVPIFDSAARMVLALSLHLDSRFSGADAPDLADQLLRSAGIVMDQIDGRRPDVGYLGSVVA
jgi:DNA-binding IclR family transcriptional regulator